jgi:hypothetical protein
MARFVAVSLIVLVAVLVLVRTHVAEGKPELKTIATVVVHAHHANIR